MSTIHYVATPPPEDFVYIVSSALASLPTPGNRVGTGDASNMPTIQASAGDSAIKTAAGAHHYRLVGLNIKAPTTALTIAVATVGGRTETLLSQFPTDIIFDRCIVKGDTTVATRRGILLDGIRCAVVDSYIYDIKDTSDTQAIWAYNTPGPLKVVNNYLSATGENLMTGGADPSYSNSVPSDIEIRLNHLEKEAYATWAASWSIKNLLEFKNAQRVLVEGNILETNYADSQVGFSFLITPRNQSGGAPWCVTQDITYRLNKMFNVGCGINIAGDDSDQSSQRTRRVTIENNLVELTQINAEDLRCHMMTRGPMDVQILHNTFVSRTAGGATGFMDNTPDAENTIWRDNVFGAGSYGIIGTAVGEGNPTFNAFFTNYTYSYNVMYGSGSGQPSYPVANNQFPSAATDVFTDYANKDYTVKVAYQGDASDATDPGADWTALNAAILHSEDGQWTTEHETYTDSTYDNAELPREYIDTTYRAQSGTTWNCTNASEFTTALAGCALGDTIVLTAGNTFTGNFTLRAI